MTVREEGGGRGGRRGGWGDDLGFDPAEITGGPVGGGGGEGGGGGGGGAAALTLGLALEFTPSEGETRLLNEGGSRARIGIGQVVGCFSPCSLGLLMEEPRLLVADGTGVSSSSEKSETLSETGTCQLLEPDQPGSGFLPNDSMPGGWKRLFSSSRESWLGPGIIH